MPKRTSAFSPRDLRSSLAQLLPFTEESEDPMSAEPAIPAAHACTRCLRTEPDGADFYVYRGFPEARCKDCIRAAQRAYLARQRNPDLAKPEPEPAPPRIDAAELTRRRRIWVERAARLLERT